MNQELSKGLDKLCKPGKYYAFATLLTKGLAPGTVLRSETTNSCYEWNGENLRYDNGNLFVGNPLSARWTIVSEPPLQERFERTVIASPFGAGLCLSLPSSTKFKEGHKVIAILTEIFPKV